MPKAVNSDGSRIKHWLDCAQAVVTILGVIIGGIWTYRVFIKDREGLAHVTVEQKVADLQLDSAARVVQVTVKIQNTGHELVTISRARINVQEVLPILGCAADKRCFVDDINDSLAQSERVADRYDWPIIAGRQATWPNALPIEPGESEAEDFEFVIPTSVKAVRIYSYVYNDELSKSGLEYGWHVAELHEFLH